MERCGEVEELTVELLRGLRADDWAAIDRLVSDGPGALLVGNGPDDWYPGGMFAAHFKAVAAAHPGLSFEPGHPEAWANGPVAWVADRVTVRFPQATIPVRLTGVAVRTGEQWQFVQLHLSVAVPDQVLLSGD